MKRKPTLLQTAWLRRVAQSGGLMVTYQADGPSHFALVTGDVVPKEMAEALIKNGWMRGQRDGLRLVEPGDVLGGERPQTYRALTPGELSNG
jgi:hypothetical protein